MSKSNPLTHPDIRAISFVGSSTVGQHIYRTGTQHLTASCAGGRKTDMGSCPDADMAQVIPHRAGASIGGGHRCMAISVAVFAGSARQALGAGQECALADEPDRGTNPMPGSVH